MSRIHTLAFFVIISSVAWLAHGDFAKESRPFGTRSTWRRRKTPLELVQVEAGSTTSRDRGSSSVLDIGSRANHGLGKLLAKKDEEQSVQISVEYENRGITGPKKNQLREYTNKQGDRKEKDVNHREPSMVQKMNQNIKKHQVTTIAEAPALMKMMLLSDSDYGMSMIMPPAGSRSELSNRNDVGGSGNIVPNDGPSKNVGAAVMPTGIIATTDNGDEIESQNDGDEDGSSAPFSTPATVTIIVVSIMTVSFY